MLEDRGLSLEVDEEARTWMLTQNDHPEWGARPLRRIIRRYLREPLADHLLAAEPQPGTTVRVGASEDALTFSVS
jgi:ATP-dependent Clp protease ATP-binding subunit ClpA